MISRAPLRHAVAAAILSAALSQAARADTLRIDPVFQNTPVWCWLAVAEMVLTHFDVPGIHPDYQCGLASLIHPVCWNNCGNCVIAGGPVSTLRNVLGNYPRIARFNGTISSQIRFSALSRSDLKTEIDNGRPVIAGISPSGFSAPNVSQHVALIVGYEENDGVMHLVVNDPFPFSLVSSAMPNPYLNSGGTELDPGQYRIRYERFRNNLSWSNTIHRIRCVGPDC